MRVLITGGAGFIGSHLGERLLARGDVVSVLDDLSTGRRVNIHHLEGRPGFRFQEGSATDRETVARLVMESDAVVHLAAAVGVRLIVERPVHTIRTNVAATEVVLEAAAHHGRRVLLASTSEVYGKSAQVPFREDDDLHLGPTTRSRWAYACSKALDEWLAFAYRQEHGLSVVVARLFNTVGPRQVGRYGMVLPTFVSQALRGDPLTVYGDGAQTRCFAHVADVARALELLLHTPSIDGVAVNVGSDREITIRALADLVKARTKSSSPIHLVPYDQAYSAGFEDMPRRVPDVTRLVQLIGYRPDTSLERIVDDFVASLSGTEGHQA
jgi:UDP-glucose 4-epimerase